MYGLDERAAIRRSHENPVIQKLYEDYLGKPLSHEVYGRGRGRGILSNSGKF